MKKPTISISFLRHVFDCYCEDLHIKREDRQEHWSIFYLHFRAEMAMQAKIDADLAKSSAAHPATVASTRTGTHEKSNRVPTDAGQQDSIEDDSGSEVSPLSEDTPDGSESQ